MKRKKKGALKAMVIAGGTILCAFTYGINRGPSSLQDYLEDIYHNGDTVYPALVGVPFNDMQGYGSKPYKPVVVMQTDNAISDHMDYSVVDSFVPCVDSIIARTGMASSDTTRAKHYRKALFSYFNYTRWPVKQDTMWSNWLDRKLSSMNPLPYAVMFTNCLNCCHRSQVLRWLAFGFGRDTSLHGQDSLNYLHKEVRFGQEPNDTVVVINILPDSFIHSINPSWPDPLTEDYRDSNGVGHYEDTLCVCELYYTSEEGERADTLWFTIPYELKKEIIGVDEPGDENQEPIDRLGYWGPEWCLEHLIKPVEEHKIQRKPLTSHYAYAHNIILRNRRLL